MIGASRAFPFMHIYTLASEPLAPSSVLACFGTEINQSYTNSASAGLDSMAAGPSDNHSDDSVELPRASFGSPGMNEPHSLYYYDGKYRQIKTTGLRI